MKPRFAMFYPDHTLIDNGEDVEVTFKVPQVWSDAPKDGMQAVLVHRADGLLSLHDSLDIYAVHPNGEPFGTHDIGPVLRRSGLVKYGLQLPNEEWDAVRERVRDYRRQYEARP
jgi:hypothetical protein